MVEDLALTDPAIDGSAVPEAAPSLHQDQSLDLPLPPLLVYTIVQNLHPLTDLDQARSPAFLSPHSAFIARSSRKTQSSNLDSGKMYPMFSPPHEAEVTFVPALLSQFPRHAPLIQQSTTDLGNRQLSIAPGIDLPSIPVRFPCPSTERREVAESPKRHLRRNPASLAARDSCLTACGNDGKGRDSEPID